MQREREDVRSHSPVEGRGRGEGGAAIECASIPQLVPRGDTGVGMRDSQPAVNMP